MRNRPALVDRCDPVVSEFRLMVSGVVRPGASAGVGWKRPAAVACLLRGMALRLSLLLRHLLLADLFHDSLRWNPCRNRLSDARSWSNCSRSVPRFLCSVAGPRVSQLGPNGSATRSLGLGVDGMGATWRNRSALERDWVFPGVPSNSYSLRPLWWCLRRQLLDHHRQRIDCFCDPQT